MTGAAAEADLPAPAVDPAIAWRLACYWLGGLSLVATVPLARSPALGMAATLVAVAAMGIAVHRSGTWSARRAWPHLVAVVIAAISLAGLCATRCGTYAHYEEILRVPTGLVAVVLHAVVAVVLLLPRLAGSVAVGDAAIAIAIGGSLFYASVLIAAGTWCGACFAIHALMAIQLAEMVAYRRGLRRYAVIATVVAAAGLANAAYHHRPLPPVRDDPEALLAYLRGLWTAELPPQRIVPMSAALDAASRDAGDVPGLRAAPPTEAVAPTAPAATPPEAPPARAIADANRWGRADAPVALALGIDLGCPACAQEFAQVLELSDLVDAGRLQVRLLLTYRNDAAQAMASIAYGAGMLGDRQLVETVGSFLAHQREILTAADAIQHLPASLSAADAITAVRTHQAAITTLMTDAARLKEKLGSTGDPTAWLFTPGSDRPVREFKGVTLAPILRLAVVSLVPTE